jgi:hypothetical protein
MWINGGERAWDVKEGWENQPILLWNMGPVYVEPVTT